VKLAWAAVLTLDVRVVRRSGGAVAAAAAAADTRSVGTA